MPLYALFNIYFFIFILSYCGKNAFTSILFIISVSNISNNTLELSELEDCCCSPCVGTSGFGTVDHRILLNRLCFYCISGCTWDTLHPIWQMEAFSVSVGQFKSDAAHLLCGVQQGSVLGSLIFALYLLALVELLIILMASPVISLLMTSSYTVCLLLSVTISCLESS